MSTLQPSGAPGSSTGRASGGVTMPGAMMPGSGRLDRAGRSGSARGTGGTGGAGATGRTDATGGMGGRDAGNAVSNLAPMLRFGVLVAIGLYIWRLGPTYVENLGEWLSYCDSTGQGLSCLTGEPVWRYALWPLLSVFGAISLLRGSSVEGSKRPNHSAVLALAALGVLAASLIWGLS